MVGVLQRNEECSKLQTAQRDPQQDAADPHSRPELPASDGSGSEKDHAGDKDHNRRSDPE